MNNLALPDVLQAKTGDAKTVIAVPASLSLVGTWSGNGCSTIFNKSEKKSIYTLWEDLKLTIQPDGTAIGSGNSRWNGQVMRFELQGKVGDYKKSRLNLSKTNFVASAGVYSNQIDYICNYTLSQHQAELRLELDSISGEYSQIILTDGTKSVVVPTDDSVISCQLQLTRSV
jgi:hypothetical protein